MISQLDELLVEIGTGWWDVLHYVVAFFSLYLPASHALGAAFLAPNINYTCTPSTGPSPLHWNDSYGDECSYLLQNPETGNVEEEKCRNWSFDNATFSSTITSEFQLTCDRAYLRASYQSVYMSGMFIGAFFSGVCADRYGRKTAVVFGLVLFIILSNLSCLVTNFSAILFCRFMQGSLAFFFSNSAYILVVEITEPRFRPHIGIISMLPWAFAMMVWGGSAYLIRDWRWLQFAVSIPGVLAFPFLWLMDESPRWLAVTGRYDRAIAVLKRAARMNKAKIPSDEELMSILRESQLKEKPIKSKVIKTDLAVVFKEKFESITILFKTPRLRKITISLYIDFLIVNMVYYGLSLSGGNLSENPFIFMVLSGLMEVPAYSLTVPIVARFGRRLPTIVSFFLSGVSLLAIAPTPSSCGWLVLTLAMFGKVAITSAYQILIFYSTELFPTEVRSRGLGTSFMLSRVGSIVSPFIIEILGAAYPWAPSAVFGGTAVLACLATIMLPETLGSFLPDTIEHLEEKEVNNDCRKSWIPVKTSENTGVHSSHNKNTTQT